VVQWLSREYTSRSLGLRLLYNPNLVPENAGYYILPESGDLLTGRIRIVMGEFVSCLPNALNYLTCAFAEQDSGSIGKQTGPTVARQKPAGTHELRELPKGDMQQQDHHLVGIP
jgi:hypothetical protein